MKKIHIVICCFVSTGALHALSIVRSRHTPATDIRYEKDYKISQLSSRHSYPIDTMGSRMRPFYLHIFIDGDPQIYKFNLNQPKNHPELSAVFDWRKRPDVDLLTVRRDYPRKYGVTCYSYRRKIALLTYHDKEGRLRVVCPEVK